MIISFITSTRFIPHKHSSSVHVTLLEKAFIVSSVGKCHPAFSFNDVLIIASSDLSRIYCAVWQCYCYLSGFIELDFRFYAIICQAADTWMPLIPFALVLDSLARADVLSCSRCFSFTDIACIKILVGPTDPACTMWFTLSDASFIIELARHVYDTQTSLSISRIPVSKFIRFGKIRWVGAINDLSQGNYFVGTVQQLHLQERIIRK